MAHGRGPLAGVPVKAAQSSALMLVLLRRRDAIVSLLAATLAACATACIDTAATSTATFPRPASAESTQLLNRVTWGTDAASVQQLASLGAQRSREIGEALARRAN